MKKDRTTPAEEEPALTRCYGFVSRLGCLFLALLLEDEVFMSCRQSGGQSDPRASLRGAREKGFLKPGWLDGQLMGR